MAPSLRSFRLARMSPLMLGLTLLGLSVPALVAVGAVTAPSPLSRGALYAFVALTSLYAWIWFYMRPARFEIGPEVFSIVWPLRRRGIARDAITAAEVITHAELRKRVGRGVRVGVGGLWGQFGFSYTRRGWLSTYISTMGPWVLIEIEDAHPLLISPDEPEQFVRALGFR